MRVTNNMIMRNSISNINKTKEQTDKLNNQMTSQKKITRASEDPVIAIRSLRLRNSQSQINQYYENNIPDAESWLENTETALNNMKDILNDVYVQCNSGASDGLSTENRKTILTSLQALRDDLYSEGNTEYTGRTIFSGYKTGTTLTFMTDETDTSYTITEKLSYSDISKNNYYSNSVTVPSDLTGLDGDTQIDMMEEIENYRFRLSYDNLTALPAGTKLTAADGTELSLTDSTGNAYTPEIETVTYADWEADDFAVGADQVLFIPETGEVILGSNVATQIQSQRLDVSITYDKTGFKSGELRPEFYFDCVDTTDAVNPITYVKEDQSINYTISANTTLTVNTQASDLFGTEIGRDVDEMMNAVNAALEAQEKVDKIESMISSSEYADDEDAQAYLSNLLEAATRERDYANDYMQSLFSDGIENFQGYMDDVTLAITDVGNKGDRLELVKTRMASTSTAVETLISNNEDKDLSEIVIEYTAAYNAYESALLAASKASSNTLLDYL